MLCQMGSRGEDARNEEMSLNRQWVRFLEELKFLILSRQQTTQTEVASGGGVGETGLQIVYLEKAFLFASHIFRLILLPGHLSTMRSPFHLGRRWFSISGADLAYQGICPLDRTAGVSVWQLAFSTRKIKCCFRARREAHYKEN